MCELMSISERRACRFSGLSRDRASDPIIVAETIWEAATDGTDQLRYIAGEDAKQIIAARKQMEDPEYLALVRSQFGL